MKPENFNQLFAESHAGGAKEFRQGVKRFLI